MWCTQITLKWKINRHIFLFTFNFKVISPEYNEMQVIKLYSKIKVNKNNMQQSKIHKIFAK